ncbi:MAG: hypothetical protein P0Y51_22415 [Candidatus Pseudomonas colombiensis]|nr:MAG: hypothetical protein P0Y51_22415 [Pseudomonas sp.]
MANSISSQGQQQLARRIEQQRLLNPLPAQGITGQGQAGAERGDRQHPRRAEQPAPTGQAEQQQPGPGATGQGQYQVLPHAQLPCR